jgi:hypothetical protein
MLSQNGPAISAPTACKGTLKKTPTPKTCECYLILEKKVFAVVIIEILR